MTEEKKAQIRRIISVIEIVMPAILVIYLIYGIVSKDTNTLVFHIIAVVVVVTFVILNDFIEPYLTQVFEEMDEFRKSAYRSYLLWDVASMAGLLFFVLNFTEEANIMIYMGLLLYFIGNRKKRSYQSVYLGKVTKADVEAAREAAGVAATDETEEVKKNIEE